MFRLFLHADLLVTVVLIFALPLGSADLPGGGTGQPWRFVDGHLLVYTEGFYPLTGIARGKSL